MHKIRFFRMGVPCDAIFIKKILFSSALLISTATSAFAQPSTVYSDKFLPLSPVTPSGKMLSDSTTEKSGRRDFLKVKGKDIVDLILLPVKICTSRLPFPLNLPPQSDNPDDAVDVWILE